LVFLQYLFPDQDPQIGLQPDNPVRYSTVAQGRQPPHGKGHTRHPRPASIPRAPIRLPET
jgi:hypothetical protein